MSRWFLYFLTYSFLGYCLEKLFARAVRSPERVRKCLLLLPLCPVYGLAMTVCAALTGPADGLLYLALVGARCPRRRNIWSTSSTTGPSPSASGTTAASPDISKAGSAPSSP